MSNKKIYLELTLGHRATRKEKATPDGFTHDWEVFVRTDQGQIQAFVDRVIFHLHQTFQKPRRVVKEPPFSVKESGYAGFMIEIEVFFKNKDEPRKANFHYDLYLQSDGPPINPCRKEKLVFKNPNEEFTKKLLEGGGVIQKDKDGSSRSDSFSSASSSYQSLHSGGKSAKHSSTNPAKASPKNSFENLFGTPIKRNSGSPSLTTSTIWSTPNGSTKDPSNSSGSSGKGGKGERAFVTQPNGSSGGKGEKIPVNKSSLSAEKAKASKSPVMPTLLSPSGSEGSTGKPTSSKSSKSRRSSSEKRSKSEDKVRKMLPPEHSAVPRKSKKSDMFTPSPSSTSVSIENSTKSSDKSKKKSSKHKKIKIEVDDGSYASPPETISRKESRKDVHLEMKKERRDRDKSQMSPVSSSSRDSSPSSASSGSEVNSEEEEESEVDSDREEVLEKSNKRIVAANSTSSYKRRSTVHRPSDSDSGSEQQSPGPQRSPPSSPASSVPSPPPKRRKSSNSSSSHTPDQHHGRSESPMEKPNSSSAVKVKKEPRHHKRNDDEKHRSSRKKSKKHKKKVFEEDHESDSSVSSVESYASPTTGNGVTSNGLSPNPGIFIASTSAFTLEMGILQELYARISSLTDPEKLQEVVDIVMDSCGQDLWSLESGLSFDFDLCKLSPSTIRKIQEAILD